MALFFVSGPLCVFFYLLSFATDRTSRAAPSCSGSSDERSSSDVEKSRKTNCLRAGSCMSSNVHVRFREKGGG
ncbi:hypothetical protein LINGRAHAP2_LOCUS7707 [Linum grandiflorum]